jgi:adenylate cyclase
MSFFAELKRRHVYRVAVLYIIVSWLVLQVEDVFLSFLPLPEWTANMIFLLLVLGFPVAMVFAWAFELTPDGLKLDTPSDAGQQGEVPCSNTSRKKLDLMIFIAMAAALAYFAFTHKWQGDEDTVVSGKIRSIVVLPLDNLMNDPDQAFFVDGLHEALITELSKVAALRVISRTSALAFRDSGKAIPEIARQLGVDAVVEGSVLRAGDKVRVTVQLIEGSTDQHLWADNFDRELTDILALYADVTRKIVDQIRITLTPQDQARLMVENPVNPQAYELFLKGRYLCNKWSPRAMDQGIELMQQAVILDPRYAPSYSGLASCLQASAFFGYIPTLTVLSTARTAALRAIELDPNLASAHVVLASILFYMEYKPNAAEEALHRALKLEPENLSGLNYMSWLLAETGRFDEAMAPVQLAIQIDPLSKASHHALGELYYLQRDYEQAINAFEMARELDPDDPSQLQFIGWAYQQMGQYEPAIALHREAVELSQRHPLYLSDLGYVLGMTGQREEALQILAEMQQADDTTPYHLAIVNLGLGNADQSIDALEKAYALHEGYLVYIINGPRFDPLRDKQRFIDLLKKFDG